MRALTAGLEQLEHRRLGLRPRQCDPEGHSLANAPYTRCRTLRGLTEVVCVALNPSRPPVPGVVLTKDEVIEVGENGVGPAVPRAR